MALTSHVTVRDENGWVIGSGAGRGPEGRESAWKLTLRRMINFGRAPEVEKYVDLDTEEGQQRAISIIAAAVARMRV